MSRCGGRKQSNKRMATPAYPWGTRSAPEAGCNKGRQVLSDGCALRCRTRPDGMNISGVGRPSPAGAYRAVGTAQPRRPGPSMPPSALGFWTIHLRAAGARREHRANPRRSEQSPEPSHGRSSIHAANVWQGAKGRQRDGEWKGSTWRINLPLPEPTPPPPPTQTTHNITQDLQKHNNNTNTIPPRGNTMPTTTPTCF